MRSQRLCQAFRAIFGRHEIRLQVKAAKGFRCSGANRCQFHSCEGTGVQAQILQSTEESLDAVGTCKDQPAIMLQAAQGTIDRAPIGWWADIDYRKDMCDGAKLLQPARQLQCLRPRTGYHDLFAEERPVLEPGKLRAEGNHRADNNHRWRLQSRLIDFAD